MKSLADNWITRVSSELTGLGSGLFVFFRVLFFWEHKDLTASIQTWNKVQSRATRNASLFWDSYSCLQWRLFVFFLWEITASQSRLQKNARSTVWKSGPMSCSTWNKKLSLDWKMQTSLPYFCSLCIEWWNLTQKCIESSEKCCTCKKPSERQNHQTSGCFRRDCNSLQKYNLTDGLFSQGWRDD